MFHIIRKIFIYYKTQMYFCKKDYTNYSKELINTKVIYQDTKETITMENVNRFFKCGVYEYAMLKELYGNHFLPLFINELLQSECCPNFLTTKNSKDIVFVIEDCKY